MEENMTKRLLTDQDVLARCEEIEKAATPGAWGPKGQHDDGAYVCGPWGHTIACLWRERPLEDAELIWVSRNLFPVTLRLVKAVDELLAERFQPLDAQENGNEFEGRVLPALHNALQAWLKVAKEHTR